MIHRMQSYIFETLINNGYKQKTFQAIIDKNEKLQLVISKSLKRVSVLFDQPQQSTLQAQNRLIGIDLLFSSKNNQLKISFGLRRIRSTTLTRVAFIENSVSPLLR